MQPERPIRLDIWSDYVCPFSYLELPELNRLIQDYGAQLHVVWRAFELRPLSAAGLDPMRDAVRACWEQKVYPMARERGVSIRMPQLHPRTRKAHETAAFARAHGSFEAMHRSIFRAYFEQGLDIAQPAVLLQLASALGLDAAALAKALENNSYAYEVSEDQDLAWELELSGVPAILLRQQGEPWSAAHAVQGAVKADAIRAAIRELTIA